MTGIFYLMLYLRRLFFSFSKIINFFLAVTFFYLTFATHQYFMAAVFFGLSFGVFMLRRCYDQILAKLNPPGNKLVLVD